MSDKIYYHYDKIQEHLEELQRDMKSLYQDHEYIENITKNIPWEDEKSAAEYQNQQRQWNQAFKDILDLLKQIHQKTHQAKDSMAENSQKIAELWN